MYDKQQAQTILTQLRKAKADVTRLSDEYRKVCQCNDFLDGYQPSVSKKDTYNKIYRTCDYHQVRMYHYANV
jgi:hypothetical protein